MLRSFRSLWTSRHSPQGRRSGSPILRSPSPPDKNRDRHRARERKPCDGVLQVIVLEVDVERTGFCRDSRRYRPFQIDVEWRYRLAAIAPAEPLRHRKVIAHEP